MGERSRTIPAAVLQGIIAPPPGELFSETNDNSVAIQLTYAIARFLLAGDAEARDEEYRQAVRTRGLKRSSKFEATK
jgi:beta-lactamase superfamily II metal-dependent hydrolase